MTSIEQRLPRIKEFHSWLIYTLYPSGEQRDPKYGRFTPGHMFHCDQVPLPFVNGGGRSLNMKGKACRIAKPGSGLDKRQVTLHLTIRAEGDQLVRPVVVFRNQQGLQVSPAERALYPDNVDICYQPKAWVDTYTMHPILGSFHDQTAHLGEVLWQLGYEGEATVIWTLSTKLFFHTGCSSGLPKRTASRFCTVSLPR